MFCFFKRNLQFGAKKIIRRCGLAVIKGVSEELNDPVTDAFFSGEYIRQSAYPPIFTRMLLLRLSTSTGHALLMFRMNESSADACSA